MIPSIDIYNLILLGIFNIELNQVTATAARRTEDSQHI